MQREVPEIYSSRGSSEVLSVNVNAAVQMLLRKSSCLKERAQQSRQRAAQAEQAATHLHHLQESLHLSIEPPESRHDAQVAAERNLHVSRLLLQVPRPSRAEGPPNQLQEKVQRGLKVSLNGFLYLNGIFNDLSSSYKLQSAQPHLKLWVEIN